MSEQEKMELSFAQVIALINALGIYGPQVIEIIKKLVDILKNPQLVGSTDGCETECDHALHCALQVVAHLIKHKCGG